MARSHECDFPADVLALPALTEAKFKVEGSSAEIDARVREIVRDGLSVYRVDGEALKAHDPDVIVTQDHCEVCAVSLADVEAATCTWTGRTVDIVSLQAQLHRRRLRRHRPRRPRARRAGGGEALVARACRTRLEAVRGARGRPRQAARGLHRVGRAADGRRQLDAGADRGGRRAQPVRGGRQALGLDALGGPGRRRSGGDRGGAVRLRPRALPGGAAAARGQARLGRHRRGARRAASTSPTATPTSTAPGRASPTARRCWWR